MTRGYLLGLGKRAFVRLITRRLRRRRVPLRLLSATGGTAALLLPRQGTALARGSHRLELVYHGDQQGLAMQRRESAPVLEVANVDFDID